MNNQHLCNRPITVSYAYKKDTKGERHGTPAGNVFWHLIGLLDSLATLNMFLIQKISELLLFCRYVYD